MNEPIDLKVLPLSLSFVMQPAPAYIPGNRYAGPRKGVRTPAAGKLYPGDGGTTGYGVTDALGEGPPPVDCVLVASEDQVIAPCSDLVMLFDAEPEPEASGFNLGSRLDGQRYRARSTQVMGAAVAALVRSLAPDFVPSMANTQIVTGHLDFTGDWQEALEKVAEMLGIAKELPVLDTAYPGFAGFSFLWKEGGLQYRVSLMYHGPDWDDGYELEFDQFKVDEGYMPPPNLEQKQPAPAEQKGPTKGPSKGEGEGDADADSEEGDDEGDADADASEDGEGEGEGDDDYLDGEEDGDDADGDGDEPDPDAAT